MDVNTTFLNGNVTEDVYMTQPEGFTSKDGCKVCKLQKSIYDCSKHLRVGTFDLMRQSKSLVSHKI